jgi:hypothetical protein
MPVAGLNCHKHFQLPDLEEEREAEAEGETYVTRHVVWRECEGLWLFNWEGEVVVM